MCFGYTCGTDYLCPHAGMHMHTRVRVQLKAAHDAGHAHARACGDLPSVLCTVQCLATLLNCVRVACPCGYCRDRVRIRTCHLVYCPSQSRICTNAKYYPSRSLARSPQLIPFNDVCIKTQSRRNGSTGMYSPWSAKMIWTGLAAQITLGTQQKGLVAADSEPKWSEKVEKQPHRGVFRHGPRLSALPQQAR